MHAETRAEGAGSHADQLAKSIREVALIREAGVERDLEQRIP